MSKESWANLSKINIMRCIKINNAIDQYKLLKYEKRIISSYR